jgi:hypothetical protein
VILDATATTERRQIVTIVRGLAAVVFFASLAAGSASPVQADEAMEGIYAFNQPGVVPSTWSITPTCVPGSCTIYVSNTGPSDLSDPERLQSYGGTAFLTGGRWTFTAPVINGVLCPDGSRAPSLETYAFDDVTLTGTHTSSHIAECGLQPALTKTPFTLTYLGPLPNPVNRYPLYCPSLVYCPY